MSDDILEKALDLVARSETCLLGSIDKNGFPAIRALLAPRKRDGMKNFHFTTNTSSQHVAEFLICDKASVYFYDPNLFQGLLLRGTMRSTTDQAVRDMIWRDGDNIYYTLGPTDPDYSVMLFTAENGRWYEDFKKTDFPIQ